MSDGLYEQPKLDLTGLEFPKTEADMYSPENYGCTIFPLLLDDDQPHPIVAELKEHPLTAVELLNDWEDDHELCFNVRAAVNGKTYGFSIWWWTTAGMLLFARAECGMAERLEEIRQELLEN
jgi:hypothetical protein